MTGFVQALMQDLRMLNRLAVYLLHGELPKVSRTVWFEYL